MEKRTTIRKSLGLNQMEMAILLQTARGQWSMYESGKRDLPANAN